MAGDEGRLAAHRPQLLGDRFDQMLVVAHREVPAADRALEQYVADDRQLRFRMLEDDVAGRVAGAVADVEGQLADRGRVTVFQPAVGLERLAFYSPALPVLVEARDPEAVGLVRTLDRDAQLLREDTRRPAMVDVTVGQQDLLDGDALLRGRRLQLRQVAARIGERPPHRLGAPQQSAILLERSHRQDGGP